MRIATTCTVFTLAIALPAQHRAPPPPQMPPPPPQLLPVVAPPVDHPAYAGQPLMPRNDTGQSSTAPAPAGAKPKAKGKAKGRFVPPAAPPPPAGALPGKPAPALPAPARPGEGAGDAAEAAAAAAEAAAKAAAAGFLRTRIEGRELQKRIDRMLKELDWHEDLESTAVAACATGKPILWVQMLGDVDGFT